MKNISGIPCEVREHKSYNQSRGLIHVGDFLMDKMDSFRRGLKNIYNIKEVVHAHWIKTRYSIAKPFDQPKILQNITLPGFGIITVNYYRPRPLFCTQYLEYLHSKKYFKNQTKCQRCTDAHITENCKSEFRCLHCKDAHKTGSEICPKQREQEEIY